jgi:ACR3 family arsenite transporter
MEVFVVSGHPKPINAEKHELHESGNENRLPDSDPANAPGYHTVASRSGVAASMKDEDAMRTKMEFCRETKLVTSTSSNFNSISFFDRYLFIWVAICMIVGSLIGYLSPSVVKELDKAQVFGISVPLAVLLWIMIFPMLLSIDWISLTEVVKVPGPILLTSTTNFLVQPFLAYGISILFFQVIYSRLLEKRDADQYIAGSILLAAAPCTAMVLVWSLLVGGSAEYTIIQVAVNDILTLFLFVPIVSLFLGAGVTANDVPPPYAIVTASVLAFVGLPLLLAVMTRLVVVWRLGRTQAQSAIATLAAGFKPITIAGLLMTVVLVFIFQGALIGAEALHILLIAVPLAISTVSLWCFVYLIGSGTHYHHHPSSPYLIIFRPPTDAACNTKLK